MSRAGPDSGSLPEPDADSRVPGIDEASADAPPGPPGGRIFSLEGRRAPGLYLVAWIASLAGVALLFLSPMASSDLARVVLLFVGAVALLTGLAAGAGSQVVERRDRHPDRYRGPAPLLVFGIVLAASTLLSAFLLRTGLADPEEPFGFLLGLLVVALMYAGSVWLFAVRSGSLTWAEMGWPAPGTITVRAVLRDIGAAVAVMLPATLVMLVATGLLAILLGVEPPSVLPTAAGPVQALAIALGAAIVAPLGEELFFRGFALTAWWRDLGAREAIIRSAIFFALIHVVNITSVSFAEGAAQALLQTAVILPLGLVLGWLFVRGGMVASVTGHVTYNAFLLLLLLLQS